MSTASIADLGDDELVKQTQRYVDYLQGLTRALHTENGLLRKELCKYKPEGAQR